MSEIEIFEQPKLSVVLASQNACGSVSKCLNEIERQRNDESIEVVVVDNSTDGTQEIIAENFPEIKLIKAPTGKFIPELWGIGINRSSGKIVAVSTTHFIPAKNWLVEILKLHQENYAGIGGAIENDESAGIVSWAVYFCRYSRYMLPFVRENVEDFAADNASYKRADLERVKSAMADGFWEVFVHREMLKEKMPLVLTPEIIVYHSDSFTFSDFMHQRFQHGRQFGKARAKTLTVSKTTALALLSPLIPFLYLYRISQRILNRKRNHLKFILSLPILFLFLVSWSAGEFIGYLSKKVDEKNH